MCHDIYYCWDCIVALEFADLGITLSEPTLTHCDNASAVKILKTRCTISVQSTFKSNVKCIFVMCQVRAICICGHSSIATSSVIEHKSMYDLPSNFAFLCAFFVQDNVCCGVFTFQVKYHTKRENSVTRHFKAWIVSGHWTKPTSIVSGNWNQSNWPEEMKSNQFVTIYSEESRALLWEKSRSTSKIVTLEESKGRKIWKYWFGARTLSYTAKKRQIRKSRST